MKLALLAASLVLVAGGAVGCGGDDGGGSAKDAPSTEEFCGALKQFQDDVPEADPTQDLKPYIKALKAAADKLEEVGVPDGMPSDAQDGFDLTVEKIKGLDESATLDDLAGIGEVSDADQEKLDALEQYVKKTCPELGGETDSSESP